MLRVHRDDFRAVLLCRVHHQLPGANQSFFIGQTDAFPRLNGGQGGFQTDHAHHSGDDRIRLRHRGRCQKTVRAEPNFYGQICQPLSQLLRQLLRGHHRQFGPERPALLRHPVHMGAGCEGADR